MTEKTFKTLEYNKIITKLTEFAVSPMAKEKAQKLIPMTSFDDITRAQKETSEAVSMIMRKGGAPFGGLREIRPQLKRANMGGTLSIEELMNIGNFAYVCRKVKNYSVNENKTENYEILDGLFETLELLPSLEKEITRCIISETEVADDASPALRSVRREIKISNDRVREQLNGIINSPAYKNMLQESVITIRNDRYCVPIKSEYGNAFQGMLHDQSNTGSTLFIEPLSVVNLNNRVKELQAKEKEEIEKILAALSALVAENAPVLSANARLLTELDFIFAKAGLSVSMNGAQPIFNRKGYINIKKGRHPLIDKNLVVPTDIYLGKEFTTLLITGPNTGGKTVALKTLGLFELMGQAGLHIPAFDNSELAVFDNVFADIGDEQSIEQSLSAFSAHMTNVVDILKNVTDDSLVLFDELGSGTDPTEGAALAMSIIESLRKKGIRTAVTTHYSELKVYAISTEKAENASCEFNVETLRPTYKLLIGVPGKSNAFAISKRLGLSDDVIDEARRYISREQASLEDVITDLEINKRSAQYEKERAEQYRQEAENLKKEVEKQRQKTSRQREKIIAAAQEEAKQLYIKAKEEADAIIKEITKQSKQKSNKAKMDEERAKLKKRVSEMQANSLVTPKKQRENIRPIKQLKVGDSVYVISFDASGTALTLPDNNNEVTVQAGALKIKVPLSELMLEDAPKKKPESGGMRNVRTNAKAGKSETIRSEIDCRGQMVEECIGNVDKYIDDAYLSGLKEVTIIHGKGTGALRSAVWEFLRKNPHIKSYRPGTYGEGEMGVTIAQLK